ncbi:hypothetical protein V3C99_014956 [Haemonchus contortus]
MLNVGFPIHLVMLASVMVSVYGRVAFDDWHCGSNDFTRQMSFESITEKCESIMLTVNHCCVVHDVCYTHQLGQERCDEEFCECNRKAALVRHDCSNLLEASCSLVQLFGFGAYHNSANYTEPDDLVKHMLRSDLLRPHLAGVYQRCRTVNATTSSCALQHNLCDDSPIECAEALAGCLHDAASVDGSEPCREAVEQVCSAALDEANNWHNFFRNLRFLSSNMLKVLIGVCLVMLICFVVRQRNSMKVDEKLLEYSPV